MVLSFWCRTDHACWIEAEACSNPHPHASWHHSRHPGSWTLSQVASVLPLSLLCDHHSPNTYQASHRDSRTCTQSGETMHTILRIVWLETNLASTLLLLQQCKWNCLPGHSLFCGGLWERMWKEAVVNKSQHTVYRSGRDCVTVMNGPIQATFSTHHSNIWALPSANNHSLL